MDATPDYANCSLRELRDVAARINREQYPDRYALVLQEIERRETASECDDWTGATHQKQRASNSIILRTPTLQRALSKR